MMKQYFGNIVAGIEAKLSENPESKSPTKLYALEIARLGQKLYTEEEKMAWTGIVAPFDILAAMGVTSCFVEFIGAMLASSGMVDTFLTEAEQVGYAGDTCGYHRAVMGAMHKGLMPDPDFLIATTCPCSGGLAMMENLAHHFKKDLFVLNIPQENSDSAVAYLAGQLKEMTGFVADHTGRSIDAEQLRQAIVWTNQARDLMVDVYRLAQHKPSPLNGRMLANFGVAMALFLGTEAAVNVARAYREELEKRVTGGIAGVDKEKVRLLWIQNRIQFKNPLIKMLEDQYQAVVVVDELNDITWEAIDPDEPYIGIARRCVSIPFNGVIEQRIEHLQKLARDYQIDGAINPCNWGCRQGAGARGLVAEGLKKVGVPVLNLEVDCVDSRNFAEGQIKTRIEAFVEMLSA